VSAFVPLAYWEGEGDDAHIVRSQGLRVILHYHEGRPTMYVNRRSKRNLTEADEYEDDWMMRWNRAVLEQIRGSRPEQGA